MYTYPYKQAKRLCFVCFATINNLPPLMAVYCLSFLLTVSLVINTFAASDPEKDNETVQFGYSGGNGPDKWGSISPKFSTCSNGKSQSPIDIVKDKTTHSDKLKPLDRDYYPANATLVNNGYNVGIHFEGNAGWFSVDGKNYSLLHMHWHTPSERLLDGQLYDAELHLVHKARKDESIIVVAIIYQFGSADSMLAKFDGYRYRELGELAKEKCKSSEEAHIGLGTLDPKQLRKSTRKYYRYTGSYTVPPCTENVIWYILGKVRSISKQQVEALKAPLDSAYKNNSRPAQALNGRTIELYEENKK